MVYHRIRHTDVQESVVSIMYAAIEVVNDVPLRKKVVYV